MNMMQKKAFNVSVLTIVFLLCANSALQAQESIRFGIKIHPNLSFSSVSDKSTFDKEYFSTRSGLMGANLGLALSGQKTNG